MAADKPHPLLQNSLVLRKYTDFWDFTLVSFWQFQAKKMIKHFYDLMDSWCGWTQNPMYQTQRTLNSITLAMKGFLCSSPSGIHEILEMLYQFAESLIHGVQRRCLATVRKQFWWFIWFFLAKVANLYYIIFTVFKKYWWNTVVYFISGTQDTFI